MWKLLLLSTPTENLNTHHNWIQSGQIILILFYLISTHIANVKLNLSSSEDDQDKTAVSDCSDDEFVPSPQAAAESRPDTPPAQTRVPAWVCLSPWHERRWADWSALYVLIKAIKIVQTCPFLPAERVNSVLTKRKLRNLGRQVWLVMHKNISVKKNGENLTFSFLFHRKVPAKKILKKADKILC